MLKRIFQLPDERGQGLAEYALILILASVIVVVALLVFGVSVRDVYCDITRELDPYFSTGIPGVCEAEGESSTETRLPVPPIGYTSIPSS